MQRSLQRKKNNFRQTNKLGICKTNWRYRENGHKDINKRILFGKKDLLNKVAQEYKSMDAGKKHELLEKQKQKYTNRY